MDLTINLENYKLNIRAGVIILHDGKILTHRNKNSDHYALLGGRVELGENSEDTIKREVKEELGKEIEVTGYISTIENFFELKGEKYHEIMFVHKAEFKNKEDKKITNTLTNLEGKDYLQYEWIDLKEIDKYPLKPASIKDILKEGKFPVHKIHNELKATQYIGRTVNTKIDRPLNSKHPKHGFVYEVNYGYIPNTISGDGEELDCYILGVDEPLETFTGECIAVIHRTNDNDDKLVVVPKGKNFTDKEIRKMTNFQEQYFKSEIIRRHQTFIKTKKLP